MKVYFETYGCSYNTADTEYMKSLLDSAEFLDKTNLNKAEIIVLNTCAVKDKTVSNLKKRIQEIKELNPTAKIVFAGCLTQTTKKVGFEIKEMQNSSMLGPNNVQDIKKIIASVQNGSPLLSALDDNPTIDDRLNLSSSKPIEIVQISKGCLNECTFCQTKLARGNLVSFPPDKIISRIRNAVNNGTKIIYLTSQDNGCYGFDFNEKMKIEIAHNLKHNLKPNNSATKILKYDIVNLLEDICNIDGDFKVRLGMANPCYVKKMKERLIQVMTNPKIFKFLHIPLQSGSDKVLQDMRRGNTVEEFFEIIDYARKNIPDISISTDLIVGYPTETETDFQKTLHTIEKARFDVVNRSKFSARPGTVAAKLKHVSTNDITKRSQELTKLVQIISKQQNDNWLNKKCEVVVEENSKKEGTVVARNNSYKPIILKGNYPVGTKLDVTIVKSEVFHLIAKPA